MQEGVEGIGGGEKRLRSLCTWGGWGYREEWVQEEGERGHWPGSCEPHTGFPSGKRGRGVVRLG